MLNSFTNNTKQFWYEVMFEIDYTLLAPTELLRNWRQQQPNNQSNTGFGITREDWEGQLHGGNSFWFHFFTFVCDSAVCIGFYTVQPVRIEHVYNFTDMHYT